MKITYFPNQPHCYAFGGFEVQMLAAHDAVKSQGYNIELLNPWNRNADFDIAHIWGFEISQTNNILYSKKANKKVIVTDLLPDFSDLNVRLRFLVSSYIYKVRILKELSRHVDFFIAITNAEKKNISKYYNFPEDKIKVIPNIVSETYFEAPNILEDLGIENFVLCVGNICQRKNQLNLVKACHELGLNVLLIGNILEGEEKYGKAVLEELVKNPSSKWIRGVKENSNTLKTAYKRCKLFALLSYHENQPISVLEALAMNCKVLLADRPYTYQPYYKNTLKVNPSNIEAIKEGLIKTQNYETMQDPLIRTCNKENVGKLYIDLYNQLGLNI
jgi:glycosyltransferase involved in cell wall biosynthesis